MQVYGQVSCSHGDGYGMQLSVVATEALVAEFLGIT